MRKQASIIFSIRVVRLAFAILNLSISAKYFGVSLERDIWLLALNAIIIFDITIWAPLNDTFRAKFLFIKEEKGEQEALSQTRSLLLLINLVTVGLVLVIMIFPTYVAKIIAPSYKGESLAALIFMIRVIAPTFILNQITKILTSILNTYNSFVIPEISGLITQVFTLLVIVLFAPTIGIISLAISYYAGLILLLFFLVAQLKRYKVELINNILQVKLKPALTFFTFSLPFFVPHLVSQLNVIVEKSLATSTAEGAVSILDYARKFTDIPLDVLIGILISLLVPVLTSKFALNLKQDFFEAFLKIYQFGFLIIAVIVGVFNGCGRAIVELLYAKGTISSESLAQIADLTVFYSWASFGVFLYHIYGLSLLSSKRGKLFAIYGTLAQFIMIAVNLHFFREYSIYVFPISLGLSHLIAAGFMAIYFPVRTRRLFAVTTKYALLVFVAGGLMHIVNQYLIVPSPILTILWNIVLLTLILVAGIFFAGFEERSIIQRYLKKLLP